jgi:hypothetical protein
MSDPISRLDQFRADAHGAPMKSAAEVRQRGDQIRRRRRAVVAAGAAAVAAVVAGPIIFLSTGLGDKAIDPAPAPSDSTAAPSASASASASTSDPSAGPTDTESPEADGPSAVNLIDASTLPELDRFESPLGWNQYTPASDIPTLACQKEWLSALGASAKVASDYRWDSDGAMVGQVHMAVLEFPDVNAAGAAYNEIMEWQEVCPADKLGVNPEVTSVPIDVSADLDAGPKRAARSQATYPGSDGNDSLWFETELVAEYETRLVLVGYAELAGPCPPSTGDKEDPCYQPDQPDSWPDRILAIEKAAVTAGISDLR